MKASRTTSSVLLSAAIAGHVRGRQRRHGRRRGWRHLHHDTVADPGNLDPQSQPHQRAVPGHRVRLRLAAEHGARGRLHPVRSWPPTGPSTGPPSSSPSRDGITCSDGSPLTASDVVANLDYVGGSGEPEPLPGHATTRSAPRPRPTTRRARVTITLAAPAPFVLNGLSRPAHRVRRGHGRSRPSSRARPPGTGPYVLSEAVPGDHYTYTIRDGYTWGPNGATTASDGMPATVVLRIVENPATAANLLLTGDVNAAAVIGSGRPAPRTGEPVHASTRARCSARCGSTTPMADRPPTPPCAWP